MRPPPLGTLSDILDLVGKLDDMPGPGTARERFRNHLEKKVLEVGQVRDYIEECLRTAGEQYDHALQDLVNYTGSFLGFSVTYGRYRGVQNQVGFDGHWQSPTGLHLVVEVKTTDVFSIKTSVLVNYVDRLIDEKKIPDWNNALGLYVVGRANTEIRQIENAIVAEKRTHQLRIISVNALLSLAEMMKQYNLGHKDILTVLRPSGPAIDTIVDLMAVLVSEPTPFEQAPSVDDLPTPELPAPHVRKVRNARKGTAPTDDSAVAYWFTPVRDYKGDKAEQCVQRLVAEEHIYAFGDNTPGRKRLKPGDMICFYASGRGVIAHAEVTSTPVQMTHPKVHQPDKYRWVFHIKNPVLYLKQPTVIDLAVRSQLDRFKGKDPSGLWAWFVQSTRRLSKHDFDILTRNQ